MIKIKRARYFQQEEAGFDGAAAAELVDLKVTRASVEIDGDVVRLVADDPQFHPGIDPFGLEIELHQADAKELARQLIQGADRAYFAGRASKSGHRGTTTRPVSLKAWTRLRGSSRLRPSRTSGDSDR